eukprot:TRINITY_DN18834_c0_g1_i1.p2 TRINITY_DN18834_c0_g1~~TRINITY_DN18834_c0_g1_i1.p2  ORF type:complete len:130 (-),score=21.61 TRINITY_DN18834_c0_g1_i1:491-880(-)
MGEALLADGAAATSSTKPASWVEAEGVDAAGLFSSQGYLWVRGVLPQSLAAAAAKEIDEMLEDALAKVEETPEVEESHFGNVRSRGSRHDFKACAYGAPCGFCTRSSCFCPPRPLANAIGAAYGRSTSL